MKSPYKSDTLYPEIGHLKNNNSVVNNSEINKSEQFKNR